jgi:hypothetical protein
MHLPSSLALLAFFFFFFLRFFFFVLSAVADFSWNRRYQANIVTVSVSVTLN